MTEAEINNKKTQVLLKATRTAYKKTFESTHGKAVLDDLRKCLPEPTASEDKDKTYYDAVRRSVMLMIEEKLKERKDGI